MHDHICGPGCATASYLLKMAKLRLRLNEPRVVPVKTWCRICGVPALLEVVDDYDQAVRHFYALDDTPMVHKGVHAERGGWGVSWRLDDVLSLVFPDEHLDNELWPMPVWWMHNYGDPESEDRDVTIMTGSDLSEYRDNYMDTELRMLDKFVNRSPRDRDALEEAYGEVFDFADVGLHFELLGFKAPFAIATCKRTGERGSLIFQHDPRFYFGWDPGRVI